MFYDVLKKECEKQGVKITPIVLECGGAKGSISNWKKGASPNSDIVLKLAQRLGVSTDYLLGNVPAQVTAVNNSVAAGGNIDAPITIKNGHERLLSAQERDLLRIYNEADGKEQVEIMGYIYSYDNKKN